MRFDMKRERKRKLATMGWAAGVISLGLMLGFAAQAQTQTAAKTPLFPPAKKAEAPIQPTGTPTTATEVVQGQNQMPFVQSNGDRLLQEAQAKYSAIIAQGGFPLVAGGTYKKGDKGPNVATLNKRLYVEGYLRVEGTQGQFADVYTSATLQGVGRFQRNHGLAVTGKVDAATVAELNVPADRRLATIAANVPRLAAYEQSLGERYLVVNIPAQQLETVSGGRVYARHNVIVGRPARPTPVVMTALATVKFNPYWNAPVSIVERDILPKLQNSREYLTKMNIKILQGGPTGPEVDPKTLDFKTLVPDNYLFRQEPGPENAMATAKIEFPSPFGIYLHDTPEKQMFNYNNRFYSSGCIRVQKMPDLVEWVLNGQGGFGVEKITSMAKTLERLDVPLTDAPQLRVAYLTAWPANGGTVAFRNDIYQMDGSGFTVGQPMPVGEMSPDGKRYVLKPLPRQLPIDAAEADGSGFFGNHAATKMTPLVAPPKGQKPAGQNLFVQGAKAKSMASGVELAANGKPKGLFDWAAYYKKQAQLAKHPKSKKVKGLKKGKAKAAMTDAKAKDAKANTTLTKKPAKKKLDCKPVADGSLPTGCKPAAPDAPKTL
jgi:L,D-transpeptidase YcbB